MAGLDEMLLSRDSQLSAFSRIELNRMLEERIPFTSMTMRTPASFIEAVRDIRLKLPVILMDGAVIYDPRENSYPYKCEMPYEQAMEMVEALRSLGLESYQGVIDNDNVFIYFQKITSEGSRQIYERLRRSPYRNYIPRPLPEKELVDGITADDVVKLLKKRYEIPY